MPDFRYGASLTGLSTIKYCDTVSQFQRLYSGLILQVHCKLFSENDHVSSQLILDLSVSDHLNSMIVSNGI